MGNCCSNETRKNDNNTSSKSRVHRIKTSDMQDYKPPTFNDPKTPGASSFPKDSSSNHSFSFQPLSRQQTPFLPSPQNEKELQQLQPSSFHSHSSIGNTSEGRASQSSESVLLFPDPLVFIKTHSMNAVSPLALKTLEEEGAFDWTDHGRLPSPSESLILGPFHFSDGSTYLGNLRKTLRHGAGTRIFRDGGIYEGWWQEDRQAGWGRLVHCDGDFYIGDWKNGLAEGQGTYQRRGGAKYCGAWEKDMQHGKGVEHDTNGVVYEGDFFKGKKQGWGKVTFASKQWYVGEFRESQMEGNGEYHWPDGRKYRGQFLQSEMHGEGVFEWQDGKRYEGGYRNDKKEGHGTMYWPNGSKMMGCFRNGLQDGDFLQVDEKGMRSISVWKMGEKIR